MIVEITKAQLVAIMDLADTLVGMKGSWDNDLVKETTKDIRLIDRFLEKNGYKRIYK